MQQSKNWTVSIITTRMNLTNTVQGKRSQAQKATLSDPIYITLRKGKTKNKWVVARSCRNGGDSLQRGLRELFKPLIVVEVSWLYIFIKIHRTIHLRKVNFTIHIDHISICLTLKTQINKIKSDPLDPQQRTCAEVLHSFHTILFKKKMTFCTILGEHNSKYVSNAKSIFKNLVSDPIVEAF